MLWLVVGTSTAPAGRSENGSNFVASKSEKFREMAVTKKNQILQEVIQKK